MATCSLNRDLVRKSCQYSLPEIKAIYLANFADVTASTVTGSSSTACTGEEVASISLASGAKFYKIEAAKNSATFEDALVVEDSGNKYRTHTLTFTLNSEYDACMHLDLDALSLGRYFAVVVNGDDKWLALGRTVGLEAETATLNGGSDNNNIQVTLSANVTESAVPLSSTAIATVKGAE